MCKRKGKLCKKRSKKRGGFLGALAAGLLSLIELAAEGAVQESVEYGIDQAFNKRRKIDLNKSSLAMHTPQFFKKRKPRDSLRWDRIKGWTKIG